MKSLLQTALMLACCVTLLSAQEAKPALPSGPPIAVRAPAYSQWIIKLVPPQPGKEQESKPPTPTWGSVVTTTKTQKLILRQTLDEKNETWDTWCIGESQVTLWPGGKSWTLGAPPADASIPDSLYEDYSQSDFPGFGWISAKNFTGVENIHGRDCLVFKDQMKPYPDEPTLFDYVACIDLKTRLPVSLQSVRGLHTYEFLTPPTEMLSVPPLVSSLIANQQKSHKSLMRRLPVR
jgi:hypothetical protein